MMNSLQVCFKFSFGVHRVSGRIRKGRAPKRREEIKRGAHTMKAFDGMPRAPMPSMRDLMIGCYAEVHIPDSKR